MTVNEVRALLRRLLDLRRWDEDEICKWSDWRQERNRVAKESHQRRRRAEFGRSSRRKK
jgi:hypothetical protein